MGFPGVSLVKNPPVNAGDSEDVGWIPELGRLPGGGNSNLPQYACWENPKDKKGPQSVGLHTTEHTPTYMHIYIYE